MKVRLLHLCLPFAALFIPQGQLEPYKGITVGGVVQPNLYKVESTGVSTKPVKDAADVFLASLQRAEQVKARFPYDSDEWRRWDNRAGAQRQGILLNDLTPDQRAKAIDLLRASLSAKGLKKSQDAMRLDETLRELTGRPAYGEWMYWVSIMGNPSLDEPWGWQFDGHHLCVNYFVLGDQVVMSPVFLGAEPAVAKTGKYAGTAALQAEQQLGLDLMRSLSPEQQAIARIKSEKGLTDNVAEAYRDNVQLDYRGVKASDMTPPQRERLTNLIREYVDNMKEGHAKVRMSEVERHLGSTYFAWIGGTDPQSVFYYRVHSPVILIECDHQRPAVLGGNGPSKEHVHTVVRTPNGNDYGKDLLRQHHERHKH